MRATNPIHQLRVEDVLQIRLDGARHWDVRRYVAEKEAAGEQPWKVEEGGKPLSERQIRRYIDRADEMIADSCRSSRKRLMRNHVAYRHNLYARAVNKGDERTALAVLDSLAKLQGLFPTGEEDLVKELVKARRELAAMRAKEVAGGDGSAQTGGQGIDPGAPGGDSPAP
ncbi:MAG TPA: hypothetical protein VFW33_16855 [Gemmataceae bacterium]|nr:hypothetical protein [Gemmataceae bacterium]